MSQNRRKGSIQPLEDVLSKGIDVAVPKDAVKGEPDMKVDLAKPRAFPVDPGKHRLKPYTAKLNLHPEEDTVKYRKGPDDNKKYKGREDLFANQE